jgi:hypothetical protein
MELTCFFYFGAQTTREQSYRTECTFTQKSQKNTTFDLQATTTRPTSTITTTATAIILLLILLLLQSCLVQKQKTRLETKNEMNQLKEMIYEKYEVIQRACKKSTKLHRMLFCYTYQVYS